MWAAIAPLFLFWFWFALRARRLFFFTSVNPGIETGGMLGERKNNIYERLPAEFIPQTLFVPAKQAHAHTREALRSAGIHFPLVAKPNIGERGLLVTILRNPDDLDAYLAAHPIDLILQDYIDLPLEVSILHYKYPDAAGGEITSLCLKENLQVTGDGQSSVLQLMLQSERASLQVARFRAEQPQTLERVPAPGETLLLEPIGNHCRGTKFLSGNHLINPALTSLFDQIHNQIPGVHYGRFDIKCASLNDLFSGKNFKILEYNGVASDPAHIYDPSIPVWEKYRILYRHWNIMYRISLEQIRKGVPTMRFRDAWNSWQTYRRYMKNLEKQQNP